MCGKIFWKGIIVFGLAFGFGIALPKFFIAERSAQINSATNSPVSEKNCVPVDKNLKYQNLPLRESSVDFPEKTENSVPPVIKSDEKNVVEKTAESAEKPAEKQQLKKQTEPPQYVPQKDSAEYQILLHKEQCFASEEQK